MEEKTKRQRPTKAQVTELEEVIHRQCQELDGWREKYRELLKTIDEGKGAKALKDRIGELETENNTLKRSNEMVEKEIERVREADKALSKKYNDVKEELALLQSRGFWKRVFNK